MLSIDNIESLKETLDVMGSTRLMADVREALWPTSTRAARRSCPATVLSKDEALRLAAEG